MDHFLYFDPARLWATISPAVFECYTTLAALAAATSKIRLGGLVTCNSYRHPPLVAKMAATLDVISHGRLEFAIGAGWKRDEYSMYGYNYPTPRVRIEQLREAVDMIKKIWTEPGVSFTGKYYHIENMNFGPKPVQQPHPPIWIGGSGERFLLRVVAEHADYCNFNLISREGYRHKMDVLKKHCSAVGRSYDNLKKSVDLPVHIGRSEEEAKRKMTEGFTHQHIDPHSRFPNQGRDISIEEYKAKRLVGNPEQCAAQLKGWLEEDVDYVLVGFTMTLDDWALFAKKVIPAVR
jgi:alkanesulfonate monooxygenase SsuD/methylene tetrahydromethanopterin reductase-like flavin-dependent oxidoreductase (luciferase family)